ncbi:hypothetical protein GCM10009804_33340 [Kribbella hippodromi]|uniref:Uncharacterized protein n=1 Tax=Kribbella hippodromi TaxID=434347 RepID=A0ABP4P7D5_9ACTN
MSSGGSPELIRRACNRVFANAHNCDKTSPYVHLQSPWPQPDTPPTQRAAHSDRDELPDREQTTGTVNS